MIRRLFLILTAVGSTVAAKGQRGLSRAARVVEEVRAACGAVRAELRPTEA